MDLLKIFEDLRSQDHTLVIAGYLFSSGFSG
jgi:hypothetical protein